MLMYIKRTAAIAFSTVLFSVGSPAAEAEIYGAVGLSTLSDTTARSDFHTTGHNALPSTPKDDIHAGP